MCLFSSYILVMIAMDRFQAICYPMNNHFWQPSRSKLKIVIAWILGMVSHKKIIYNNFWSQSILSKIFIKKLTFSKSKFQRALIFVHI